MTESRNIVINSRNRRLRLIQQLYELIGGVGHEASGMSSTVLAEMFGVHENVFERARKELRGIGALSVRFTGIPVAEGGGRIAHWTLTKSYEEVERLLQEQWKNESSGNGEAKDDNELLPTDAGTLSTVERIPGFSTSVTGEFIAPQPKMPDSPYTIVRQPVVLAKSEREETRAIAGPDSASPFAGIRVLRRDESAAYVAAAKQYAQRSTLIDTKLRELEDAGIVIDRAAIHFDRDEQFEAVGQALPYITALENTVKNLEASVADLQRKSKDLPELRSRVESQKRQIDRMVADKVNANA
jgi:hypothetical protein